MIISIVTCLVMVQNVKKIFPIREVLVPECVGHINKVVLVIIVNKWKIVNYSAQCIMNNTHCGTGNNGNMGSNQIVQSGF